MKHRNTLIRRSADEVLHAIKDRIRDVRYTIRAEVVSPGAALPKSVANIDLGPFIAAGAVVGTPALKVVDGLLTQVESLATEVIKPHGKGRGFPVPVEVFFAERSSFSDLLYEAYKRLLAAHGIHNILLAEQALDQAQSQFRARHGDNGRNQVARTCAGLTVALAEARPIRKFAITPGADSPAPLMLAPNVYCAAVFGLVTALVTRDPQLQNDPAPVLESVESVVAARFDRFKRAMSSKSPIDDLAAQFEPLLPFLP